MITEITAGIGSLKAAIDIVQALNGMQSAVQTNGVKLTLQGHILNAQQSLFVAQQAQSAAAQRIADLEREVADLKDWSTEQQRYERADAGNGTIAYRLKAEASGSEPAYWLCPQCFSDGKPSILQPELHRGGATILHRCNRCRTELITWGQVSASYAAVRR